MPKFLEKRSRYANIIIFLCYNGIAVCCMVFFVLISLFLHFFGEVCENASVSTCTIKRCEGRYLNFDLLLRD